MNKSRLLLVVSETGGITDHARNTRRATYQEVADKIGAELLVTAEGCGAQLLDVPLLTESEPPKPEARKPSLLCTLNPNGEVDSYGPATLEAFRLVEGLLSDGRVKLIHDRYSGGSLRFVRPHLRQPSAVLAEPAEPVEPPRRWSSCPLRWPLRYVVPLTLLSLAGLAVLGGMLGKLLGTLFSL
jgi:hypothetical protein